ncbi:MAG: hypothetical protein CVV41_14415 [Candidatus Riflebacteria bacterium HGW-Riflebacteria-1]|jgi:hypothetical protein|nr:MAG: hypothetical protein CVV41_14415 [Candidatus Riflebacteria bacterium HGW-Riflebacteria-1]
MYRLFLYLKRRGFTLAEILVATVIAGYCIMPIVGTMQGGIRHTENFNHREKLRMLARSRLNQELSAGAFSHTAINPSTSYHYVFKDSLDPINYKSVDSYLATDSGTMASFTEETGIFDLNDIMFTYKVSTEVKENVTIATTTNNLIIDSSYLMSPKGLKALVVKAELLESSSVIATDSISYMSLLNIPTFGDNYIWVANSNMLKVLAVDPTTRSIAETFSIPLADLSKGIEKAEQNPNRPWNIDIHPTRRVVGAQCESTIRMINVDQSHPNYRDTTVVTTHPVAGGKYADIKEADATKAEEDRGFVFRPDGKFFFVTSHSNKFLYVYGIDVGTATHIWPPTVSLVRSFDVKNEGNSDTDSAVFTDLIAGNDGYLYLAIKDKKNVIRFPMYPDQDSFTTWRFEQMLAPMGGDAVSTVATSFDGKWVYIVGDNKKVAQYSSSPLRKIGVAEFVSADKFRDMIVSPDSRYLMMTDKVDDVTGGLRLATISSIIFANNPTGAGAIPTYRAHPGYKMKADLAVIAPTGNTAMFTHKDKPEMYFANIGELAAQSVLAVPGDNILDYDSTKKPAADMVSRPSEYLAIGSSDNSSKHTVEFLDLGTLKLDVNKATDLRAKPAALAISPQGNRLKVGFGSNATGLDTFNLVTDTTISTNQGTAAGRALAYSNDDDTLSEYAASFNIDDFFASLEVTGSNAFWAPHAPRPSGIGIDIDLDTAWQRKDLIGMPNGGFLVLYARADGNAMLEWIGKIKWGTDKGKYAPFARWLTSDFNNFPPRYAQNIAISPCEGFLAIEARDPLPNKVHLYDFGGNNFGHETQLKGWISDYRVGNDVYWNFNNVISSCVFTGSGISIKAALTCNESWTGFRNYPGNFDLDTGVSVSAGVNTAKRDSNRRVFGYFAPTLDVGTLAIYNQDYSRLLINHNYWLERLDASSAGSTSVAYSQSSYTASLVQLEFNTNGGNIRQGIFTHTNVGASPAGTTNSGAAESRNVFLTGWTAISSETTRPFNFKPTFLRSYNITGCSAYGNALAFSRDVANPILFVLDATGAKVWALKPGQSLTRIVNNAASTVASQQLVVSPDSQKLIFASGGSDKTLYVTDIGNPLDSFFDGTDKTPSTGFGRLIASVTAKLPVFSLAAKPFTTYKSTLASGSLVAIGSLPAGMVGNNNAALGAGGIYIMGGTSVINNAPVTNIYCYNPATNVSNTVSNLNLGVKFNSVAAYDNMIYSFQGITTTSTTTKSDWVQRYNSVSGELLTSYDEASVGLGELQVSYNQNPQPTPILISDSGHTNTGGGYNTWRMFDGVTGSSGWQNYTTAGEPWSNIWAIYNYGSTSLRTVVNKIVINNNFTEEEGNIHGVENFQLHGSNENPPTTEAQWMLLTSGTVPQGSTSWPNSFANNVAYQHYRIKTLTCYEDSIPFWPAVREMWFYLTGIRPIPHVDMTSDTAPSPYKVYRSGTNSGDEGYYAFDVSQATCWQGTSSTGAWVGISASTQGGSTVRYVKMRCGDTAGRVNSFSLEGSSDQNFSSVTQLPFAHGGTTANAPNTTIEYLYAIDSSYISKHNYYRLKVNSTHDGNNPKIHNLRFYDTTAGLITADQPGMSKVALDSPSDVPVTLPMGLGAACTTPYGIIIAGGQPQGFVTATTTALVYWPHGTGYFASNTGYHVGISRTLRPLATAVFGHNLVWHKGTVYRIGGFTGGTTNAANVDIFDFDANTWTPVSDSSASYFDLTQTTSATLPRRAYAGVCSFGDEIFIFGGMTGGVRQAGIHAWNPDTKVVRDVTVLPAARSHLSAVACGSSIYLFGGTTDGTNGTTQIFKFTP